jgi:hypothetical protein
MHLSIGRPLDLWKGWTACNNHPGWNDISTSIFLENEPERSFRAKFTTLLSPIAETADANAESSNVESTDIETQHDIRLQIR